MHGVMLQILMVPVTLSLRALTVPVFLTALVVYGHRYASWLNLVFHACLSRNLPHFMYVCSFQLRFSR